MDTTTVLVIAVLIASWLASAAGLLIYFAERTATGALEPSPTDGFDTDVLTPQALFHGSSTIGMNTPDMQKREPIWTPHPVRPEDEPTPYVSITTVPGALWTGYLVRRQVDDRGRVLTYVLEQAELHQQGTPTTPAVGPTVFAAEQVHFWTVMPAPAAAGSPPADA